MGIQDHSSYLHWTHTLLPNLWMRGYVTSRGGSPIASQRNIRAAGEPRALTSVLGPNRRRRSEVATLKRLVATKGDKICQQEGWRPTINNRRPRTETSVPNYDGPRAGVLGPNWEGSYEIEAVIRPRVYKLARLVGGSIPPSLKC